MEFRSGFEQYDTVRAYICVYSVDLSFVIALARYLYLVPLFISCAVYEPFSYVLFHIKILRDGNIKISSITGVIILPILFMSNKITSIRAPISDISTDSRDCFGHVKFARVTTTGYASCVHRQKKRKDPNFISGRRSFSLKLASIFCFSVTIGGNVSFKGFFLQARDAGTNEWIGSWAQTPNTNTHPECSAVTHADPRDKEQATFIWNAPPNSRGRVYFTWVCDLSFLPSKKFFSLSYIYFFPSIYFANKH